MEIVICVPSSCFRLEAKSEELFYYLFLSILAVVPGCKGSTLKKKIILLCCCQCLAYAHTSCVGDFTSQPKQKVRWPSAMHAGSVGVRGRLMTIFYFILKAMSNVVLNIKIDGPQSCERWAIWRSKTVLRSTSSWVLYFYIGLIIQLGQQHARSSGALFW